MLAAILEDTPLRQNTTKETYGDHKAGEWGEELISLPVIHASILTPGNPYQDTAPSRPAVDGTGLTSPNMGLWNTVTPLQDALIEALDYISETVTLRPCLPVQPYSAVFLYRPEEVARGAAGTRLCLHPSLDRIEGI